MVSPVKEIALLIPCYNEEKRLRVENLRSFIKENREVIDFIFIDDGSLDKTSELIQDNLLDEENVALIKLEKNSGKGNAVREGILRLQDSPYLFYGFIDADLDIPFGQILKLHKEMRSSNHLLAISNRNLLTKIKLTRFRSLSSILMVLLANRIINLRPFLKDTQCGCKLFKKEILNICFQEKFISEWLFDIELFLRLKKNLPDARNFITEVPLIEMGKTQNSNFKFFQNLKLVRQLYHIHNHYNQ